MNLIRIGIEDARKLWQMQTEAFQDLYKKYQDTENSPACCFSERMRKLFRKNEKNVLRFCNKKAKEKRRLQRVKKPM